MITGEKALCLVLRTEIGLFGETIDISRAAGRARFHRASVASIASRSSYVFIQMSCGELKILYTGVAASTARRGKIKSANYRDCRATAAAARILNAGPDSVVSEVGIYGDNVNCGARVFREGGA